MRSILAAIAAAILVGATGETTPAGRPGRQMFFLRAWHVVLVTDDGPTTTMSPAASRPGWSAAD